MANEEQEEERILTKQQQKNAKKKAKQKARKTAAVDGDGGSNEAHGQAPTQLQGSYLLKVHQYAEIAQFLVDEQVSIPTELMQMLRSCIRMRKRCLKPFMAQPDDSTHTHAHFIQVLCDLHETLDKQRQTQAKAAALAKGQPEPVARPTNRFALPGEQQGATEEEEEEELPDIQLPEAPRPPKSSISAAHVRGDLEDTKDKAVSLLLLFYSDLHSVRTYLKALWEDFRDGKADLLTASVTTNTALELLRRPHDDVMARALPFFNNSADEAVGYLVYEAETDGTEDIYAYNLRFDYFFAHNLICLKDLANTTPDTGLDFLKLVNCELFNPDRDLAATCTRQCCLLERWNQVEYLMRESYRDYGICVRAPEHWIKGLQQEALKAMKASHHRIEDAPFQTDPFRLDEFAKEVELLMNTRKPTLLGMFHVEMFALMNFTLGRSADRGLTELRIRAGEMMLSLGTRDKANLGQMPQDGWTPEDTKLLYSLKLDCAWWCCSEDPVSAFRRAGLRGREGPGLSAHSTLMERNPMMCGLQLFRLQLRYQQLGLKFVNACATIMYTAHLYGAMRWNAPLGEAKFQWPDMDKILEIHGTADIFGSRVPENADEAASAYFGIMEGVTPQMLQAVRLMGTESSLSTSEIDRILARKKNTKKAEKTLRDHTQMLPIFQDRFLGNAAGTCIDVSFIETLLKDIKAREVIEEEKRERNKEGGTASRNNVERELLRKGRSHRSPKISIPQLLAVLEAGLRSETESIRFDYFSMHAACQNFLGEAQSSGEGPPPSAVSFSLPGSVGTLLTNAVFSHRRAELQGHGADARDDTRLLTQATQAVKKFYGDHPEDLTKEVEKLRDLQREKWKRLLREHGVEPAKHFPGL